MEKQFVMNALLLACKIVFQGLFFWAETNPCQEDKARNSPMKRVKNKGTLKHTVYGHYGI